MDNKLFEKVSKELKKALKGYKGYNILYSQSYGGQIELKVSDKKLWSTLDNENSKLFKSIVNIIYDNDLEYEFNLYNIVIYEE